MAEDSTETTGSRDVHVARLDLADPASIADFTTAWHDSVHVLVNNAGVSWPAPEQYTEQGWERPFATNHPGHFALATALHGAPAAPGSRPVFSGLTRELKRLLEFPVMRSLLPAPLVGRDVCAWARRR